MNPVRPDHFTYAYFIRMLHVLKGMYHLRLLGDGLAEDSSKPQLFIRHDVDVDIRRALIMAEIEAEHGIQSAYLFIPNSRLYDIRRESRLLQRFVRLKHEVALHFDIGAHRRVDNVTIDDVQEDIERDCQYLEDITGHPVRSISFHRPMLQFLRGELTIAGRINAYSAKLMTVYISDSKGTWRNGEPLSLLRAVDRQGIVQLLIHPIWWAMDSQPPHERLESFYLEATAGLTPAAKDEFDLELALTIPAVRRSNYRGT